MAIKIDLNDANKDGKGVNFDSYMKDFDKNYEDYDGRGGFNGKMTQDGDVFEAPGYATNESQNGGRSVLFGSSDGFSYDLSTHVVSGKLNSMVFGDDTKIKSLGGEDYKYTNSGDITISGFNVESSTEDGELIGDLKEGRTFSLMNFLKSDDIKFTGSKGSDTFTGFDKDDTLHGDNGNDRLKGGSGDDTIWGDAGNDQLGGGGGADTFAFKADHGHDKIIDFKAGTDVVDFGNVFATFDDVQEAASKVKAGVLIEYDGGSVLLQDVKLGALTAGDFDL